MLDVQTWSKEQEVIWEPPSHYSMLHPPQPPPDGQYGDMGNPELLNFNTVIVMDKKYSVSAFQHLFLVDFNLFKAPLSSPFRCQYCKTLVSLENDRDCSSFYLASFLLLSLDAMALNTTAIMVGDIYRNTDTPTDGPSPCQLCRELWNQDKVERMISLAKLFTHVQNYLI